MRAKLKGYSSPDFSDIETFVPKDPEDFGVLLQLSVGPQEGEAAESFDVQIMSPKRIQSLCAKDGFVLGLHLFVVFPFDGKKIMRHLTRLVENCDGKDWNEVALKVSRFGNWEFEGYVG